MNDERDIRLSADEMVARIANDGPWVYYSDGTSAYYCKYCGIIRLFYCSPELEHKNDCLWKQSLFRLKSAPEQHVIKYINMSKGLCYCENCEEIHDADCPLEID